MSRRLHRAVDRWLSAERAGARDPERALGRVFRAMPAPPLPAGFAERVMRAAGLAPVARAEAPLVWRILLAASLALGAAATATAPALALDLLGRITLGDLLRLAAGAVVESCQRLAEGLAVWRAIGSIGETFVDVLSAPSVLIALLTATLLSAGGFRMLHGLLAIDRRRDDARA